MIDETLLKKHSIGKDGVVWWLGQVCESDTWWPNIPLVPSAGAMGLPGFADRVKVSILGYHTCSKDELKNEELPWAYCLKPTTSGGNMGGAGESINLQGGEWVFGFFLDGEDGQQPIIIGVLGKSDQQDFRLELPNCRFEPFTGYTNRQPEPLTNQKQDDQVGKSASGTLQSVGEDAGGVKVESKLVNEQVRQEADPLRTIAKDVDAAFDLMDATDETQNADPSDCNDPMDIIDKDMIRMSKLRTFNQKYGGIYVDKAQNIISDEDITREEERQRDRAAAAQKIIQVKTEKATLEGISEAASEMAVSTPLSHVPEAMDKLDETTQKVIAQFNGIIDALPSQMQGMIKSSASKIINQPPCVVQGYTAGSLAQSLGQIDGIINGAMSEVNSVLSMAGNAQSLAKQGLGAAKALAGGDLSGVTSMLSGGLGSLGGISVPLEGLPFFTTSYKKIIAGEKALPCVPKSYKGGAGGDPGPENGLNFGSMLEGVSSQMAGMDQLVSGISDLTKSSSIFDSGVNLGSSFGLDQFGGIGAVDDALKKASNLGSFAKFPGTTGQSIQKSAMSLLQKGESIDAAMNAAETIFPGGASFIKEAFGNQLRGKRKSGSSCDTGPSLNGPPVVDIWGGEGNGALANAVIGPNGNLLAVQIKNCGKGFATAPYVAITDSSGRGQGAVARAVLNEDKRNLDGEGGPSGTTCIKEIIVVEPGFGYMSKSDGSVGGMGRTFASKDDTVFTDKDGGFYKADPSTLVSVPPGGKVWFPAGTAVELPSSAIKSDGEPVVDSNKLGKIRSIQVVTKKGFKGFAKVTDGSSDGAGPILNIKDVVNDKKISNVLERETGNFLNANEELEGNRDIIEMFKAAELRSIEGTPIEVAGGGQQQKNILGRTYQTLDPWRAGLTEGTTLTFRGAYNGGEPMTADQKRDPYNLIKNNKRYFIFDFEVEVYKLKSGSTDSVKDTWYRLIDISYVTGTEDWKNGEIVGKKMYDNTGRLYELYLRICTYDDEKVTVNGHGLNSNSEVTEVIRTKLPNGEFVEESRRVTKSANTVSYELPCGGEFTTPPPAPPAETEPGILVPIRTKGGRVNGTGSGYGPNDTILVNGIPAEFCLGPDGRIICFKPPRMTVQDYPEVVINSQFGAGADLEVDLEAGDAADYPDMEPQDMVEVVDCVGKNIFIVEN